mgnify:CR=1 FL=1
MATTEDLTPEAAGSNVRITVSYAGQAVAFNLEGTELSEVDQVDGSVHRYFTTASETYVGQQVANAVKHLAHGDPLVADLSPVTDRRALDMASGGVDPVRDTLAMLVDAPIPGGGTEHALDADLDGDGWNEPFSARYACCCGGFAVEWVQTDPEQSGRPDPVAVALAWREHYEVFCATQAD